MQDDATLVFVYGSLRRGGVHPNAARLAGEAEPLGAALWRGRLYDLGAYPGAVSCLSGRTVTGDLYRLIEPAGTLSWLDAYEDLGDATPGAPRFLRERHVIAAADGTRSEAWLYRYTGSVRTDALVPDGDWLAWLARRARR